MVGVAPLNPVLPKHLQVRGPMAPGAAAWLALTALTLPLLASPAHAQATPPARAASATEMVGNTPNDALQRQALSPYRFILNVGAAKPVAKPAAAAVPAPAPTAPPAVAAQPRHAAPSPAPVVAKAVAAPAPEPAKPAAPAVAAAPAPTPAPAPTVATTTAPSAAPAVAPTPVLVAAAAPTAAAPKSPAPLPPPATVVRKELVPLQQDPPVLGNALLAEIPHGLVKVRFDVNPDGSTSSVQVASSSHRKLNGPVVAAVSKWRFQPIDAARAVEIELSFNNE